MGWSSSTGWNSEGWSRAASAAAAPAWFATGNPASQNVVATSVTFTAVPIGTASADRIVVALYNNGGSLATGMTIGGVTATKAVEELTGISALQIWYAAVPTGTTADFVVTAGGNMNVESLIVGKLTGVTAAPPFTSSDPPGSADPATISVNVPATGFGIVGIFNIRADVTWTNAAEDFNVADANGSWLIMAHDTLAGTNTVSASGLGGQSHHMVSASWGP